MFPMLFTPNVQVMLSGLEDEMLASVCLESGAVAVFQKPLDTTQVQDLIRSVLQVEFVAIMFHSITTSLPLRSA